MALLTGLSTVLTILVVCAFWIGTGWPDGAAAAELSAVVCCLFATLDDPAPAQARLVLVALVALIAVGIGLFAILPMAHDFETLAFALGVFFVPLGVLIANPATQALGTGLAALTATFLSLESAYAADFTSYANSGIAALLGIGTAAVVTALVRSVGAEWSARRLLRAIWRDLAAIPRDRSPQGRAELAALLLDRLGLLVPRLAAVGAGHDLAAVDALADLRIGIDMVDMQRGRTEMLPPVRAAVDDVLFGTATHFAAQAARRRALPAPPGAARPHRPRARCGDGRSRPPRTRPAAPTGGIRRALFAAAPPYQPALAGHAIRTAGRQGGLMIGDFDVAGVFVPALLAQLLLALLLTAALRRVLARAGFYRLVWHRPLVDLSLLVIILAALAATLPHWVPP